MKNIIKKTLRKAGIDIIKHIPQLNPLDFLKAKNIQTVLDVGANVGQFAEEIQKILPEASIYSFEPLKECFEKLERNLRKNKNFKAFNFALGEKNETLIMHKSLYTPSSSLEKMSSLHKEAFPHTESQTLENVEVKVLDEISKNLNLRKEILVKIDVQGFEDRVLRGGSETIKKAKIVLIESSFHELYIGQLLFDNIYKKMQEFGFTYNGSIGSKKHPKTGEILFEDSIFIK